MPVLYNIATKKPEALPFDQIESAISNGTHSYEKDARVNIQDRDTGDYYNVTGAELQKYLQSGKYSLETPVQKTINDYVEDNQGIKGSTKVFLEKALNQLAFNVPETIMDRVQDPLELAKRQALTEDHKLAALTGNVTGFGGSLFVGGPIFKGAAKVGELASNVVARSLAKAGIERGSSSLAKDIVARLATNVTKMGAEGIAIQAPEAITEVALGDPEAAAESVGAGAVFGGILGAVTGIAPDILKAAKNMVPYQSAEEMVDKEAGKILGFKKGQIKKITRTYGLDAADDVSKTILNAKIEQEGKLKNVFGYMDKPEELAEKIATLQQQSGQKLDEFRTFLDSKGSTNFSIQNVMDKIDQNIGNKFSTYSEAAKQDPIFGREYQEFNSFKEFLKSLGARGEEDVVNAQKSNTLKMLELFQLESGQKPGISLQMARDARAAIWDKYESTKNPMYKYAYGLMKKEEDAAIELGLNKIMQKGEKLPDNLSLDNYKLFTKQNWASRIALDGLTDKIASKHGNRMFGPMEAGSSLIGAVTLGAPGVVLGFVGKKLLDKYGHAAAVAAGRDGIFIAQKAMKRIAEKYDQMPGLLKGSPFKGVPKDVAAISAITRMLGDHKKSTDKEDVKLITDRIAQLQVNGSDPSLEAITQYLSENGAPETAAQMNYKFMNMVSYLSQVMPKRMQNNPFRKDQWEPSDTQVASFKRVLHAVYDPTSIIDDFKHGTLTKDKVDAVKAIYPKLYDGLVSKIHASIIDGETKPLAYSQRIKMGLLLGANLEDSIKNLPQYQLSFQSAQAAMSPDQMKSIEKGVNINVAPQSMQSETQRIASRA